MMTYVRPARKNRCCEGGDDITVVTEFFNTLNPFQTCFLLSNPEWSWCGRKIIAVYDQRLQLNMVKFKMLETIFVKRGQSFDDCHEL